MFRLSVAEAPADDTSRVVVQIRGVEIQPSGGQRIDLDVPPHDVELTSPTGGDSEELLPGLVLPAGHYEWLRLKVVDGGSYIDAADGRHNLRISGGAEHGLKVVRGFDVPVGGTADFTIDFDARKSVHPSSSGGDYVMRPTLRMVDNARVGSVSGTVDPALLADPSCTGGSAVYVYPDPGTGVIPDDRGGSGAQPVITAPVAPGHGGPYSYRAAFLEAGTYTLAVTCQAASDDPATDDALVFAGTAPVTVTPHADAVHDF